KHLRRLMLATRREVFGSFHISQPIAAPTACTTRHGSKANKRRNPTTRAPLSFSTGNSRQSVEAYCNHDAAHAEQPDVQLGSTWLSPDGLPTQGSGHNQPCGP